ncbi:MAG: FtsX-like permease family protein [Clostridiales bacterium]|nr:FtsX-like permease family protein [Clostridiales bacterium]
MFSKLAFKNVTKSIRDYTIYFLTMTFGVCLFYMFNSIDSQAAMMKLSTSQYQSMKMLTAAIGYVSVFISVILGFLIVYANGFLIKRRKKELGIYMTLGMNKGKISRILIAETFLIGLFALGVGLLVGVFAAQGLSVVTAKMFEVSLKSFQFTFSMQAFYKTLLYFGIIFLVVMVFNTISISRLKLIDLLTAGRKNESLKIKRLWISVLLFLVSAACLAAAYRLIIQNGMMSFGADFTWSIVLGCVGTLLFFFSLSGFLLRVVQANKKLYFKNLNMFVLRQINSKINTTFLSMSVICVMLLITIGTLSTGMGMSNAMTSNIKNTTPYDASFTYVYHQDDPKKQIQDIAKKMLADKIDLNHYAKEYVQLNYYDSKLTYSEFHFDRELLKQNFGDAAASQIESELPQSPVEVLPLSDYNKALALQGKPTVDIGNHEFLINCTVGQLFPQFNRYLKSDGVLTINGKKLTPAFKAVKQISMTTAMSGSDAGTVIVPDDVVKGLSRTQEILNVNYKPGADEEPLLTQLDTVYNKTAMENETIFRPYDMMSTRNKIYAQSVGLSTMISYLAIYIGLVFLITSAAILALQQLSEASDNAARYGLLRKLGAEEKMVNRSLFTQIGIYFFIPLSLAVVHSIVGIKVANNAVSLLGHMDILGNTLVTAAVFLVIYGGYFLATYFGSRSILRQSENSL